MKTLVIYYSLSGNTEFIAQKAAEAIGADQPKISKILNGKFNEFSIERITEYMQKLGYDIHVSTMPAPKERLIGMVVMDQRIVV